MFKQIRTEINKNKQNINLYRITIWFKPPNLTKTVYHISTTKKSIDSTNNNNKFRARRTSYTPQLQFLAPTNH